jgi:hypothetical protein
VSIADAFGLLTATWAVAALTAAPGIDVDLRMYEKRHTGHATVSRREVHEERSWS